MHRKPIDFTNIEYLRSGNARQQLAYRELNELKIFQILGPFDPILTGTIPIEIDIPESDLDLICHCTDHEIFEHEILKHFSHQNGFAQKRITINSILSTVACFKTNHFEFEIFGQNIPTTQQNAYQHMIKEHDILMHLGEHFKDQVIQLKRQGIKTEPAFAQLLNLPGNPYTELLKYDL